MKKSLVIIILSFFLKGSFLLAQPVKAKISSVTIYRSGAVIEQSAKVKLHKGLNTLELRNLAAGINNKTLNYKLEEGSVVSSGNIKYFVLKAPESPEIKALKDSLDKLNSIKSRLLIKLTLTNSKIDLLNTLASKETKIFSVHAYKKMLPFYSSEMLKYLTDQGNIKEKLKKLNKRLDKIKKQLSEINGKNNKPVNAVKLVVRSSKDIYSQIKIVYFTNRATWKPTYKIIADSLNAPLKIEMNAEIRQNTNIDWKNVPVKISTRKPYLNNNKPRLNPIFIDFYQPPNFMFKKSIGFAKRDFTQRKAEESTQPSTAVNKGLMIEFIPKEKINIPTDNRFHLVPLRKYKLKANYQYFAVPSKSSDAFLTCEINDWEKLNLLSAGAYVYFKNSYVGSSFINTRITTKTITVSLGRDEQINVSKNKVKDFKETDFFGRKITRSLEYSIKLKNNKNKTVNLIVEDQIPVSRNEKIEVELLTKDYSSYNKKTGILTWNITLSPFQEKELKLIYTLTYPVDKQIRPVNNRIGIEF